MDNTKNTIDICIEEMNARHLNMKKFLPYFELMKLNKTGVKYKEYDMATLSLVVIYYILMEGKLKERGISFQEIQECVREYIKKAYLKELDLEEERELTRYILLKLQNEGESFKYTYYDSVRHKESVENVRYITFRQNYNANGIIEYYLTSEGIEFFLQTKEFGEESKVTIYLLLLQKQLQSNNFENVYNLVIKINTEVQQQIDKKKEIERDMIYASQDSFNRYTEYTDKSIKYLVEEKDLFESTFKMISEIKEEYLNKANVNLYEMKESEKNNIQYLFNTSEELSLTVDRHSKLLSELVDLKKKTITIRDERRKNAFKKNYNFENFLNTALKVDNVFSFKALISPLLKINVGKSFTPEKINNMFLRVSQKTVEDKIVDNLPQEVEKIISVEEVSLERIKQNFKTYFKVLLSLMVESKEVSLIQLTNEVNIKYGEDAVNHPDFREFIFTLNSRKDIGAVYATFNYKKIHKKGTTASQIEEIYKDLIDTNDDFSIYKHVIVEVEFKSNEEIRLLNNYTITDFIFRR